MPFWFCCNVAAGYSRSTNTEVIIEYELGDEDVGDWIDVMVKRDPLYGTPVFRFVAGAPSPTHVIVR